jgi:hypothetical protein
MLEVIEGGREELLEAQRQAIMVVVLSTDPELVAEAHNEAVAIQRRLRRISERKPRLELIER